MRLYAQSALTFTDLTRVLLVVGNHYADRIGEEDAAAAAAAEAGDEPNGYVGLASSEDGEEAAVRQRAPTDEELDRPASAVQGDDDDEDEDEDDGQQQQEAVEEARDAVQVPTTPTWIPPADVDAVPRRKYTGRSMASTASGPAPLDAAPHTAHDEVLFEAHTELVYALRSNGIITVADATSLRRMFIRQDPTVRAAWNTFEAAAGDAAALTRTLRAGSADVIAHALFPSNAGAAAAATTPADAAIAALLTSLLRTLSSDHEAAAASWTHLTVVLADLQTKGILPAEDVELVSLFLQRADARRRSGDWNAGGASAGQYTQLLADILSAYSQDANESILRARMNRLARLLVFDAAESADDDAVGAALHRMSAAHSEDTGSSGPMTAEAAMRSMSDITHVDSEVLDARGMQARLLADVQQLHTTKSISASAAAVLTRAVHSDDARAVAALQVLQLTTDIDDYRDTLCRLALTLLREDARASGVRSSESVNAAREDAPVVAVATTNPPSPAVVRSPPAAAITENQRSLLQSTASSLRGHLTSDQLDSLRSAIDVAAGVNTPVTTSNPHAHTTRVSVARHALHRLVGTFHEKGNLQSLMFGLAAIARSLAPAEDVETAEREDDAIADIDTDEDGGDDTGAWRERYGDDDDEDDDEEEEEEQVPAA